ncbi:hypothetical protein [Pseudorhizobium marinum]|uniref:hypothetical protein n=1 Tax=Pseudorhizobium marinum TaxID=1496690 RepID=UPI001F2E6609|nr:hypothetical protein [Pseudorhizobium marinum]
MRSDLTARAAHSAAPHEYAALRSVRSLDAARRPRRARRHYCRAQTLKRLDASVVMPMDFLRVPMAAIVGHYAYAETVDLWVFLGGWIIVFSNYQAVMMERRLAMM